MNTNDIAATFEGMQNRLDRMDKRLKAVEALQEDAWRLAVAQGQTPAIGRRPATSPENYQAEMQRHWHEFAETCRFFAGDNGRVRSGSFLHLRRALDLMSTAYGLAHEGDYEKALTTLSGIAW